MIDSTNPRQLADNIRKLWDKFKSISGDLLPSRSTATAGQILKLTGEAKTPTWADEYTYTPPAYSETETATGRKLGEKEIYQKRYTSTFGTITQTTGVVIDNDFSFNLVDAIGGAQTASGSTILINSTPTTSILNCYKSNDGKLLIQASTSFSECAYDVVVFYTKPDPTPGRAPEDQEPEPEEKKTTKKKTK